MSEQTEQWETVSENIRSQYQESYEKWEILEECNKQAREYYQRLCRALAKKSADDVALSAPLSYFEASSSGITRIILPAEQLPALIGIPDTASNKCILSTLPYGVARIVLEHYPELLDELKNLLRDRVPDQEDMLQDWFGDIVAKLMNMALLLDREKFKEVLLSPIKPQRVQPDVDITPTIEVIFPYIGLEILQHFVTYFQKQEEAADDGKFTRKIDQIKEELDQLLGDLPNQPCQSIGSRNVSLHEVKEAMRDVVRVLLAEDATLNTLGGKSFFEFLITCTALSAERDSPEAEEKSEEDYQQVLMKLSDLLPSARVIPLAFSCRPELQMSGAIPEFAVGAVVLALIKVILGG